MRFKKFFITTFIFLFSFATVFANNYLFDTAEILTSTESSMLESKLESISKENEIGVYIITIKDYEIYGSSITLAAKNIYSKEQLGIGELNKGLLLLISMNDRSYDLDSYNNKIFNSSKRNRLENAFLDDFKENNWFSGLNDFVDEAENILYCARTSKMDEDTITAMIVTIIVIIIISFIIAMIRLSSEKKKLNNIKFAENANIYESEDGINYKVKKDLFTYSSVRTVVHESSSSSGYRSGGSGHSGVSHSRGSSGHSHSSGHF